MGTITVSINVGRLFLAIYLIVVLIAAAWVLITDYQSSYTWILPLDAPKSIMGYWKTSIGIGIYDLGGEYANYSNTLVVNGLVSHIYLDKVESGYAIVAARGFNSYVLLVTALVLINAVLLETRVKKSTRQENIVLKTLVLLVITLVPILSLVPYIAEGSTLGYRAYEYPVREYAFQDLLYAQLPLGNASGLELYKYVYNITVTNLPEKSLVRIWFTPGNDSVLLPTLVYVEAGAGGANSSRLLVSNGNEVYTALYIEGEDTGNSYLKILVFSEKQLNSSRIGYYVLSFYDGKTQPNLLGLALPLVFTSILVIYGVVHEKLWGKQGSSG
ncbi:MAG: hypothetical protein QXR24_04460 [Thermosphaera sp.]